MKTLLRKLHLITGLILLIVFPLTGAYLRARMPHLPANTERWRFSMRGNHVYILLFGLVHLLMGVYFRLGYAAWVRRLQTVASALLIQSSAMVVAAFFFEPKDGLERPLTLVAMVMALVGSLLHAGVALWDSAVKEK
ncbi:MAG TPA: hypothetical protein PLD20_05605 [Blastocatellia bacterium]|nr:hypothetical protein [Blastocatellia bacterium]HMX25734.1 hypothetical protein [Blastocatellia bacterium]HMY74941.1 hypothetical protein [Blastocatellia bacterium]HMZ17382.1 hypothetical protein [Blastocatellia bacterium]HNG28623.1 hypothetical protein [Blastocatellia bacterium]